MRLTWLGHSTVVIDIDGVRLVTDPLLRAHAGPLRRLGPAPRPEQYAGAAAVLLSHLHTDHAEPASLRLLGDAPVVSDEAIARWVRHRLHRPAVALGPGEWWTATDEVSVRLVPAVHPDRPMPHRPNTATGHVVRGRSGVVWFAGDTQAYDGLATLSGLAGAPVDVALVPIAGWGPRLGPGHLDARGAAAVCATVGARYAMPIHYGTLHPPGFSLGSLRWVRRPLAEFHAALARLAPGTTLLPAHPGAPVDVPLV